MPRNTAAGAVIAAFGLIMCFALIWHIWDLALFGLAGMVATFIQRTYDRDVDYYVPAAEVARIETALRTPAYGIDPWASIQCRMGG
ncbi:hypothetical protein [Nitrospirillum viridazoti]|uniref:hypothetical protein n=1 Tax=Nitrospirillum viridazoti TaxID=3144925 RepID=UPI000AB457DE|nr:hypothetical protein [Nitrospirillum amazonense]TWB35317.1 hypothetical protein FBZ91_11037 [Nitrospirillum amazonense]